MNEFDQEVAKKLGKETSEILKQAFQKVHSQIEEHYWKLVDQKTYDSPDLRQDVFNYYVRDFYEKYELYLDVETKTVRVRPRVNPLVRRSLKEILTGKKEKSDLSFPGIEEMYEGDSED